MNSKKPILLVEDDEIDVMTFTRAIKELNVGNRIESAPDGEQALELLEDPSVVKPCLIVLDLNMPRMNGLEFLKSIKSIKPLKLIPVVVLTTSGEVSDRRECFDLGAAGYMIKPMEYSKFKDLVKKIMDYWSINEFPDLD